MLAPRLRRLLLAAALLGLGAALGYGAATLHRPALEPWQDAVVADVRMGEVTLRYREEAGGFIDIAPAARVAETLLIVYPGGLVRPQAYSWLGVALAPLGVRTLIPRFPFDLAVTAPGRAGALLEHVAAEGDAYDRVVLAGHSLGGAMAARFALGNPEALDALVLMAAYSAASDDLSALPLAVLVLAADEDGLATWDKVDAGLARLPQGASVVRLPGAVHAFFGRYGPQAGDGQPSVSRDEAERAIMLALRRFVP